VQVTGTREAQQAELRRRDTVSAVMSVRVTRAVSKGAEGEGAGANVRGVAVLWP
jgi:hypothetical protein